MTAPNLPKDISPKKASDEIKTQEHDGDMSDQRVIVQVAVPLPIRRKGPLCYDYRSPKGLRLSIGQIVEVPLGKRSVWGVVMTDSPSGDVKPDRLKQITAIADLPALPPKHLAFLALVSDWTMAPFGMVMRMMLSTPKAFVPPPRKQIYGLMPNKMPDGKKITPKRQKVLDFLAQAPAMSAADIAKETGISQSVIKMMAQSGFLASYDVAQEENVAYNSDKPSHQLVELTKPQEEIAQKMASYLGKGFSAHLLDGVTGSGKTEVYFALVAQMMAQAQQILILLPEIALTAAWQERFAARFGIAPLIWHSSVSPARRRHIWRACLSGAPVIVVGARSALFLPFTNLGAIIIDEEHEASFKQEDMVIYHARDMAVMRAHGEKIPVIMATATPALETWVNAGQALEADMPQRYHHWQLLDRVGEATLPAIKMIDLKKDRPSAGRWLSDELVGALTNCLADSKQALLFLNRRGYAPLSICEACGTKAKCQSCDSWLVTHRLSGTRQCHHCGYRRPLRNHCDECGVQDQMRAYGPGVERLAEEVAQLFPDARCSILSSDTTSNPEVATEMIRAITDREIDIVIGTQMAAKGHHFPHLTLVGVVDADFGLQGGDLRAAERTYQMLSQASGRAGRGDDKGIAYLQSYEPDNAVFKALATGDRDKFLTLETQMRHAAMMPPFGRLAAVILSGVDEAQVETQAKILAKAAPHFKDVTIFGPVAAPIARIRGRYRMRFLLRAPRGVNLQEILSQWLDNQRIPSQLYLQIDIDPYSFM